jgi:hypothetical protein
MFVKAVILNALVSVASAGNLPYSSYTALILITHQAPSCGTAASMTSLPPPTSTNGPGPTKSDRTNTTSTAQAP